MSSLSTVTGLSVNAANIAPASNAEWPSFRGAAVPERNDPHEVGYDFVRAVHHRLSQPITALRCSLELLELTSARDSAATKHVALAMEQADRVMEIITSFRALFEADRVENDLAAASLTYVLNEVVDDLRPVGRERRVEIVLPWNAIEVQVRGSRAQLRQALWNVIQNCIELTTAGKEVRVHLQVNGGIAELSVSDVSELREGCVRMFDPFSYGQNANGEKVSNLPIAIMQRIVIAMGGKVTAPVSGAGRCFVIALPVYTGGGARAFEAGAK